MPPVSAAAPAAPHVDGGHRLRPGTAAGGRPPTGNHVPPPAAPETGGPARAARQSGGPASGRGSVRRPAPGRRPSGTSGLTAPGAVVLATGATLLGGLLDRLFTDTLGWFFATVFLVACALVAAKTRIRDLTAAFFAAPIAFAVTVLVLSVVFPSKNSESFVIRTGLDMFTALTFKASVLWTGTVLAALVVVVRRRADREATRRRAAREARENRDAREGRDAQKTRDPRAAHSSADRDRAWSGQVSPGIHSPRESRDIRETPRER